MTDPFALPGALQWSPDIAEELWDDGVHGWVVGTKSGLQVAVIPFAFTAGLIIGRLTVADFYQDRWCYHTVPAALAAALAWDGEYPDTEPTGWHRHPLTGRRVDAAGEPYVVL